MQPTPFAVNPTTGCIEPVDDALASWDAYARLSVIDGYPNQPEIVEWPITELEWVEMQALEALAATEYAASVPAGTVVPTSPGANGQIVALIGAVVGVVSFLLMYLVL